ncbi:hypothetical protein D3C78_1710520 [compost metagenome]
MTRPREVMSTLTWLLPSNSVTARLTLSCSSVNSWLEEGVEAKRSLGVFLRELARDCWSFSKLDPEMRAESAYMTTKKIMSSVIKSA